MSIVTNNLILYYDAINNTGSGEHDSSVTSWVDLSGNGNNGTINNGTWYDNYLAFNGDSTWVNCGVHNYDHITYEVIVEFGEVGGASEESNSVICNHQSYGCGIIQKDAQYCGCAYVDSWNFAYGQPVKANVRMGLAMTYDGNILKLFRNGMLVSSVEASGVIKPPISNTVLSVGSNPNGTKGGVQFLTGNVYSVRVYNSALTDEEILSNYEDDLTRYPYTSIWNIDDYNDGYPYIHKAVEYDPYQIYPVWKVDEYNDGYPYIHKAVEYNANELYSVWNMSNNINNGFPYIHKGEPIGAFANCKNLTKVSIPKSVKTIGPWAFINSNISSVTISSDCKYYDTSFPYGCKCNILHEYEE